MALVVQLDWLERVNTSQLLNILGAKEIWQCDRLVYLWWEILALTFLGMMRMRITAPLSTYPTNVLTTYTNLSFTISAMLLDLVSADRDRRSEKLILLCGNRNSALGPSGAMVEIDHRCM